MSRPSSAATTTGVRSSSPRGTTSSWATIATTARIAAPGAWCRRNTSPARCRFAGGRCRRPVSSDRYSAVSRVLVRVLVLNLAVALAKILFGYSSGAISILSDGFHSLTDGASNVIGLVGIYAAERPPDADHPYGHRKYETVAAATLTL